MWDGRLSRPACLPLELEAELRRNHDMIANRSERFADELFVRERPVRFGRVEEIDAFINGRANDADAITWTGSRAVSEADPHAPEAERRDFQSACAQHALLHFALLRRFPERSGRQRRPVVSQFSMGM
jgi:hypothetical protein